MGGSFGLNSTLRYTEFEFDSLVAEQSLDSEYYTTDWPLFLLGKPLNNVAAIKILEAQIPFSYYVFNSGPTPMQTNNQFTLTENVLGTPFTTTVTIPEGNYTYLTMPGVLASALNAASNYGLTYTVTYNQTLMTLTITNSASDAGDWFQLNFGANINDVGQTNPRLWLGFSGGPNRSGNSTGSANTAILNAPSVVQLTGPNYIYICSRFLGGMVKLFLPSTSQGVYGLGADGPQVAKVPMITNPGGVVNYKDPDPQKWFDLDSLANMAQIDFYCVLGTANSMVPLTFNGNSFSIKLGVLTNEANHNDYLGGGQQNDRIVNRSWPVNTGMRF